MPYRDYVSSTVLEPVIWKSLIAIEGQAVNLVPIDQGNLRDSITIATNKRAQKHGQSDDDMKQLPSSDYEGAIGTAAEYARAVEEGRADIPNYPAQPYLRPALDWFRSKIGLIGGKEFKAQIAMYNIRHPHKVKEYIAK